MKNTAENNKRKLVESTDKVQVLIDQVSADSEHIFDGVDVDLLLKYPKKVLTALSMKFLKDHTGQIKKAEIIGESNVETMTP